MALEAQIIEDQLNKFVNKINQDKSNLLINKTVNLLQNDSYYFQDTNTTE